MRRLMCSPALSPASFARRRDPREREARTGRREASQRTRRRHQRGVSTSDGDGSDRRDNGASHSATGSDATVENMALAGVLGPVLCKLSERARRGHRAPPRPPRS
jgi:hypothetical protein